MLNCQIIKAFDILQFFEKYLSPVSLVVKMKYVYGAVISRRLGRSIGVSVIPFKTCSYSCVYCQLGRTTNKTIFRQSFFPKREILEEIIKKTEECEFDYITFVGDGEPTLCKDLGWLIEKAKGLGKVAVITNGSLLFEQEVREELAECDVVIPSLDAADQKTFLKINRPVKGLLIERIVEGMVEFRKTFKGELNIEVMLVKGYNDSLLALSKIRDVLRKVNPDRVYLMTFTRPPTEKVKAVSNSELMLAYSILSDINLDVEIIAKPERGEFYIRNLDDLISVLRRHPMRRDQIEKVLEKLKLDIDSIKSLGILEIEYNGVLYYVAR